MYKNDKHMQFVTVWIPLKLTFSFRLQRGETGGFVWTKSPVFSFILCQLLLSQRKKVEEIKKKMWELYFRLHDSDK